MAVSIPSKFKVDISTQVDDDYGTIFDQTDDGNLSSRDLYSNPRYIINASWSLLDKNDAEELRSFLLNNRASLIDVTVDSRVYTCTLVSFPKTVWMGGTLRKVTASFNGVSNE